MYLEEFYDYKNQLVSDIISNPEIVRLLNDNDEVLTSPEELIYTQIFPYEYVPETIEHGQTFVCCDVDVQRSLNKTFLSPVLYIWIFTHKSKLRLTEGGVRVDRIASEISKTINGSRYYGLGELNMYSSKRFAPINDYQGKVLTFHMTEFNRTNPTGKTYSANRKRGQ